LAKLGFGKGEERRTEEVDEFLARCASHATAPETMPTWAEDDGDELPPPPPGFEDVHPGAHADAVDAIAKQLTSASGGTTIGTPAGVVDAPDLALKTGDLREEHAGEVMKTIVDPSTPYTSAKSFEDLGLSAELLR